MPFFYTFMHSPVGELTLIAQENALVAVLWENESDNRVVLGPLLEDPQQPILQETQKQLEAYFAGTRQVFDLPLQFYGTAFQKQVWQALLSIPYGETRSYQQIAVQIGNIQAVRAVGAANRKNPISIIAPCHRVIGKNGKLIGFAGGLDKKQYLLNIEK